MAADLSMCVIAHMLRHFDTFITKLRDLQLIEVITAFVSLLNLIDYVCEERRGAFGSVGFASYVRGDDMSFVRQIVLISNSSCS